MFDFVRIETKSDLKKGEATMAMAIQPTPVLKGKEARAFRDKIEREASVKIPPVATPNVSKVRELILAKRNGGKK